MLAAQGVERQSVKIALRMSGIRKAYPGVVALDDVALEVARGEVHVLLGENGAGKSTLMKILSGAVRMDAGRIELYGETVVLDGPRAAQTHGIRTIYQELNLVPQLSASENVFLGRERSAFGVVDRRRQRAETDQLLRGLGVVIDADTPVGKLSVAQQQMVAVAKALREAPRVLIMDEPTSALTDAETSALFAAIAQLTARGVAVVYISHRMDEVKRIGTRVTILRDGRNVATCDVAATPVAEMIRLMADRELGDHYPRRRGAPGEELLRVENLGRSGAFADVSFSLRRGEILGIAGLLGAGRTELARVLAGADRADSGRVFVHGRELRAGSPRAAIARGIGLLPEDRKTQGLVLALSVGDNLSLPSTVELCRLGVVNERRALALAQAQVDDLRIRTPRIEQPVMHLSGGNQQKVVLGKWLAANTDVLLMDEPTRGIDVSAKVEIYELMNALTARGAAIVMISSELPEILGMSDRILVLSRGRVAAEFSAAGVGVTQAQVLAAALGEAQAS
jgi:ribose transport system ATP-binding protein